MRLQVCPGLHERVEPGESLLGQRPTKPDQRRPRDAQPGERALRLRLREAKLDVEALSRELEREPLKGLHCDDEQHAAHVRPAKQRWTVLADDPPARARRKAAA